MPDGNDTAHPGVLTLPAITYERATIQTVINGKPFMAEGWVNGPGCPGRIKAEYARKLARFAQAFLESNEVQKAAQFEFLHDALCTVFERPPSEEMDLLAGDEARAEGILIHLKWQDPEKEADADPEADGEGGSSTTPPSSPTSAPPTARPHTAAAGSTSPRA